MSYNQKNVTVRLMTKVFQEKNAYLAERGGLSEDDRLTIIERVSNPAASHAS
jgi:hypothetical protein